MSQTPCKNFLPNLSSEYVKTSKFGVDMKQLLALSLAVFSFAAVNADLTSGDNDQATILPIDLGNPSEIVDSEDGDNQSAE